MLLLKEEQTTPILNTRDTVVEVKLESPRQRYPGSTERVNGGSATVLEHPSPNENGGLEDIDRGRHGDVKQLDGSSSTATENLWQMQRGQQEVCPGLGAGNTHPKCPAVTKPFQEPGADAAGEGGLAAYGNSGDGPIEETHSQVQGGSVPDGRLGKKKHRRRPSSKKKRRWKPYFKLTWEEKKEFDERETARASRVRAEMFAKGLPVAPYNTTQFLMEEHDREEPDLNTELGGRRSIGANRAEDTASEEDCFDFEEDDDDGSGGGGSDGIGRPGNAGGEFLQRDFSGDLREVPRRKPPEHDKTRAYTGVPGAGEVHVPP
ncbi:hypothetical protein SKAU_G00289810 [Synaphobranchus kaupii]|uniref:Uncharacterized protein n=1 Tax=Synaphobranchus kaupii TaxID=118154 RepID=A0A9Q1IM63_SYNKA|nr:hypothetical protein SKAU_G00289810 [Synaphobranchus kaupii]